MKPAKRWFPRLWKTGLAVLLVMLAGSAAFSAWLLKTERGAQFAVSTVIRISGGAVKLDGMHGHLASPFRIDRLSVTTRQQKITLENVQLDWRPWALLRARLHVASLQVGRMHIAHTPGLQAKPARMPDSISLPFAVQIDKAQIDASEIGLGKINVAQLGTVSFGFDFDRARYRLQLAQLEARSAIESDAGANRVAGNFSGLATLSVDQPYALQVDVVSGGEAMVEDQAVGIKGQLSMKGSLAELMATLDLTLNKTQVQGNTTLRPFSEDPLVSAKVSAYAVNLAALHRKLPHTKLDFNLTADENEAGRMSLTNTAAGQYSEGRVPLSDLQIAFRQQSGLLKIEQMTAKLGSAAQPAGVVSGQGQYGHGELKLTLDLKALDLRRLDKRMLTTKLAGQVDIKQAAGRQEFTIGLTEPRGKKNIALSAHAIMADDRIAINRAELVLGKGSLKASGEVNLSGKKTFSAEGQLLHFRLQDIGRFEQLPATDINGKFSLRGTRDPKLAADLAFTITDSKLGSHPLQGEGQAQLRADRLLVPRLLLAVGLNKLQMSGELSEGDSQLVFALDASNLAQLGDGFGGNLQVRGSAHGGFNEPRIDLTMEANKLRTPGKLQIEHAQGKAALTVGRNQAFFIKNLLLDASARDVKTAAQQSGTVTAHVQFSPQDHAPLAIAIHAENLVAQKMHADRFSFKMLGTTAQHAIDASLAEPEQSWTLKANGGLRELGSAPQWQGRINRLDAAGKVKGNLVGAAPFFLSQQRMQLDQFRFDADTVSLTIEQFMRTQNSISSRGHAERMQLASLLQFTGRQPAMTTDLQLASEWDVNLAHTLNGSIKLRRQSGDIVMQGDAPVPLGLTNIDVSAEAVNGQISFRLDANGKQLGHVEINAKDSLGSGPNRLSILPHAPLTGAARFDIPSLAWMGPLFSTSVTTEGRLQSHVALGGSFASPRLTGKLAGNGLRMSFPEQGVDLQQGTLDGEFQNDGLQLKQLRFQSAGGSVTASGMFNWADGANAAHLALKADHFSLLNRVDRKLVLSGEGRVDWADNKAKVNGTFDIHSGYFDIGRDDAPQLSDDVVIVGRTDKSAGRMIATTDIRIGLDSGVTVKGRGLDAVLTGQLHLTSSAKEPLNTEGKLTVSTGTYRAYGRKLAIEKGELRFNGALGNPALDILAMQRGQEVEAGVAVRGTVLAPRITLVSEPSVPDSEKLAWLVLGRGLDTTATADMSALQAAAGALLTGNESGGVQSQLAAALRLDDISIKSNQQNNVQQRIVTLGKQLSSKLYVGYEQGVETASSVLHLRYTLSKRMTLEGEAGTRSAVSVFFNFLFD